MKSRFLAFWLSVPLAAAGANAWAEEAPDYIDFMAKAEPLAVAASSVGSCKRLGFSVSEQGILDRMQQVIDDAERGGMPAANANMLLSGAIDQENQRQAARSADVQARKADPQVIERFLDYWEDRCERLAADAVYGSYFRR